ncbi:MAG TPA: chemotaxis response regulator protein-glutamate methylesterase [bacterium]|nr:chemotaxis response regulator protein-glutamate methylesterase [bacterium]
MKSNRKIRVLIVDDSILVRRILGRIIEESPEFELAGEAPDGRSALDLIPKTNPDVITLDLEMPEMDGLTALEHIMTESPTPVIVLSAYSKAGADHTIAALELGAVDFIPKPHPVYSRPLEDVKDELFSKLRTAAQARVRRIDPESIGTGKKKPEIPVNRKSVIHGNTKRAAEKVISIGVSTGGPKALRAMIPMFPSDLNASILIVQHMPAGFTRALADRLNDISRIEVREAENNDRLLAGRVYIARGDYHLIVEINGRSHLTQLTYGEKKLSFRPSIDVMMKSTATHFHENNIGVIMTGMCSDGVEGVRSIKKNGGYVIAQDQKTSTVFGMNKLAIQAGVVNRIVPLDRIVPAVLDLI